MLNATTFFLELTNTLDCAEPWQLGFQDPATPVMEGIIDFHHDVMFFLIVIGIMVSYVLGRVIVAYHEDNFATPTNTVHATTLEIVWTITPAFVLMIIAVPSFALLYSMDEIIDPAITIKVVGHQWYWSYEYSDYATLEGGETINFDSYLIATSDLTIGSFRLLEVDNKAMLPINTHTRLLVTAADVLHCWTVPSFGIKIDACPGRLSQGSLFIKREGTYYGQCSEICGVNHGFMPIVVKVVPQGEYDAWVRNKKEEAFKMAELTEKNWTAEELTQRGEGVYQKNCVACHRVNGRGLTGIFPALAGSDIVLNNKAKHIEILMEGVQGAAMQSFANQLSEVDMASVITYTRQAWGNAQDGDGQIVVPKDIVEYKEPKV